MHPAYTAAALHRRPPAHIAAPALLPPPPPPSPPPAPARLPAPQVEQATRSTNKSLQRLVNKLGKSPEEIYAALCKQTVDLVFTAHPTQVRPGWARGLGRREDKEGGREEEEGGGRREGASSSPPGCCRGAPAVLLTSLPLPPSLFFAGHPSVDAEKVR